MTLEELSYFHWDLEQWELKEVKEALRQANSGRIVPHATVKRLFQSRCISSPPLAPAEPPAAVDLGWSDHVIGRLRLTCEYFERCGSSAERYLSETFSTVELICKHPGLGRPGRVRGTREWDSGMVASTTVVFREVYGEIQILGLLHSRRKRPHMKAATG
jgi:plasmid stabilization system protein ParE